MKAQDSMVQRLQFEQTEKQTDRQTDTDSDIFSSHNPWRVLNLESIPSTVLEVFWADVTFCLPAWLGKVVKVLFTRNACVCV